MITILIILGVLFSILVAVLFNSIISRKNQVEFAFSAIDAMLKKRYDLIPNLVDTCKKYMEYERAVLAELTYSRAKAVSGDLSDQERAKVEGAISRQMRTIFALAENYPSLKASDTFLHLQASLSEVEEQIAASRRAFNAAVTRYNNSCQMFPTSIIAGLMGYEKRSWFEIPEEERRPVRAWDER